MERVPFLWVSVGSREVDGDLEADLGSTEDVVQEGDSLLYDYVLDDDAHAACLELDFLLLDCSHIECLELDFFSEGTLVVTLPRWIVAEYLHINFRLIKAVGERVRIGEDSHKIEDTFINFLILTFVDWLCGTISIRSVQHHEKRIVAVFAGIGNLHIKCALCLSVISPLLLGLNLDHAAITLR